VADGGLRLALPGGGPLFGGWNSRRTPGVPGADGFGDAVLGETTRGATVLGATAFGATVFGATAVFGFVPLEG
jgi:hypothetical protein